MFCFEFGPGGAVSLRSSSLEKYMDSDSVLDTLVMRSWSSMLLSSAMEETTLKRLSKSDCTQRTTGALTTR